jgi:hypothetical protein
MGEDRAPHIGGRDIEEEQADRPTLPRNILKLRAKAMRARKSGAQEGEHDSGLQDEAPPPHERDRR